MNSEQTLHICLVGLHPLKSRDNIMHLVHRILAFNDGLNIKINIIHDTTDKESYLLKQKMDASPVVNWLEYESRFLKSGNRFRSRNYASLIMQHEPMEFYVSQKIPDEDFILRCRSDYYLTDEFLQMVLSKKFYTKLENNKDQVPIFNRKIWMPYMGPHFLNFCDYFYVISVKDQRDVLITGHEEARRLWFDSFLSKDKRHFAERIFFIKPLLGFLYEHKMNKVSETYWDLINSNFVCGGDPSKIKTCFFGWRGSAWCGKGRVGFKTSGATAQELHQYAKKIQKYSKISPDNIRHCLISKDKKDGYGSNFKF